MEQYLVIRQNSHWLTTHALTARGRVLLGILGLAAWILIYLHLAEAARWLTYSAIGLPTGSHGAAATEFFLFEVPKVILLLLMYGIGHCCVIVVAGTAT